MIRSIDSRSESTIALQNEAKQAHAPKLPLGLKFISETTTKEYCENRYQSSRNSGVTYIHRFHKQDNTDWDDEHIDVLHNNARAFYLMKGNGKQLSLIVDSASEDHILNASADIIPEALILLSSDAKTITVYDHLVEEKTYSAERQNYMSMIKNAVQQGLANKL